MPCGASESPGDDNLRIICSHSVTEMRTRMWGIMAEVLWGKFAKTRQKCWGDMDASEVFVIVVHYAINACLNTRGSGRLIKWMCFAVIVRQSRPVLLSLRWWYWSCCKVKKKWLGHSQLILHNPGWTKSSGISAVHQPPSPPITFIFIKLMTFTANRRPYHRGAQISFG